MEIFTIILFFILGLFLGFSVGRFADKWGGKLNSPHHWIYGLILIGIGLANIENYFGIICFSFGIGLFISDLKDFLDFKVWSKDKEKKWKFWNID